ncbi:hypothetical protein CONLIGDRAFT_681348 [Coniochaeta ligniaria NRRL 30616]|uniref:Uncharacterized protein n=1 Tax=Coniochaeta ligniaria NRRL 30616 TaxID=1408157 RepID=A0A1J7JGK1_9PEZI|nr:hypothetical protein CONLIGDRAFT_681348 [Coniochaeta ligniaria NRRL 30616]
MAPAQTEDKAGQLDATSKKAREEALLVKVEQSVQGFHLVNSAVVDTIKEYVSGDVKDFKTVIEVLTAWSQAKLQYRKDYFRFMDATDADEVSDDDDMCKRLVLNLQSVYKAQVEFEKARALLDSSSQVDKDERDIANKRITITEKAFADVDKSLDIFRVFSNVFMLLNVSSIMSSTEAGTLDRESPQVAQATNSSAHSSIEAQADAYLAEWKKVFITHEQRCSTATEIIDKATSSEAQDAILLDQALADWDCFNHAQNLDSGIIDAFNLIYSEIANNQVIPPIDWAVVRRLKEWTLNKLAAEVAYGEAVVRHVSCSPVLESERERLQEQVCDLELIVQNRRQVAREIEIQAIEFELSAMEYAANPNR